MYNLQIPKDLREYEPKFAGPFSFREAVAVFIAGVMVVAGTFFLKWLFGVERMSYIPALIPALVPLFFGFGEKGLHMKPEIYLKTIFTNKFVVPKKRTYMTNNVIDIEQRKTSEMTEKKIVKKKKKKTENNNSYEMTPFS